MDIIFLVSVLTVLAVMFVYTCIGAILFRIVNRFFRIDGDEIWMVVAWPAAICVLFFWAWLTLVFWMFKLGRFAKKESIYGR